MRSPTARSPSGITARSANEPTNFTVVSLHGEHDMSTKVSIVTAIARAAQRDGGDLLVDLSGVMFMDASTVGALVESRDRLQARSQSLELQAPSSPARRVLECCGLVDLVRTSEEAVHPEESGAHALSGRGGP